MTPVIRQERLRGPPEASREHAALCEPSQEEVALRGKAAAAGKFEDGLILRQRVERNHEAVKW
jgi:hypothetical protein